MIDIDIEDGIKEVEPKKLEKLKELEELEELEIPNVEIDMDVFDSGVDSVTELMGKIAGLIDVGVAPESALEYFLALEQLRNERLLNEENIKHSLDVVKINAEHGIIATNERVL